ncbi:FBP domain-containing protein [Microbacterium stercoris]|uniref:FBP domain-containing protein n=1 Tax=Microbacterium stercoris TaxID=2820289 RepID=A0A939TWY5_9MICO|nr:FBP domain-containing protein [Microbacterium stercoris]MBO3663122.1 FBP domain-containing protein [Microbacterium stercoris]
MRALTEAELRSSFVNSEKTDSTVIALPHDFLLTEWDHLDFLAWMDPRTKSRGYILMEVDGAPVGVVLRAADGSSHARSAFCNICRTLQPGNQVTLFSARRAGPAGEHGDSVGTYMCADLSCHENVRLAMPLAPNEYRGSVDLKIDGTKRRTLEFVQRVLAG